jgi:hypothetical protein
MRAHSFIVMAALAGALLAGAAGCGNEAPLFPSYAAHVKPILEAHCNRCHGAGGTLNGDPLTPPIMGPKGNSTVPNNMDDFTTYAGAVMFKGFFQIAIDTYPMPPPPSTALTPYERDTLVTWAAEPVPAQ